MASSSNILAVCLILVCVIMCGGGGGAIRAQAAVSCGDVVNDLITCVSYVSSGGNVPPTCCTGVKTLHSAANTTVDRQNVCNCIKSLTNGMPYSNFNLQQAASLPGKCGVKLSFQISPSTNCKSVK